MYFRSILRALGVILLILGLTLLVPALYAWAIHSPDLEAFLRSAVYTIGTGGLLLLIPKSQYSLRTRDGFALVSFGWLAAGVVGGLPYLLADVVPSFTDAFFESVSGFTTTGASIFTVIEDKPLPVLLWRSMTQWFGGMGIIVDLSGRGAGADRRQTDPQGGRHRQGLVDRLCDHDFGLNGEPLGGRDDGF